MALFFTILIPTIQLFLIGFAINTNVRHIPTVIYDAARTQESRRLLDRFVNSDDFKIVSDVTSDDELNREIISGRARRHQDSARLFAAAAGGRDCKPADSD